MAQKPVSVTAATEVSPVSTSRPTSNGKLSDGAQPPLEYALEADASGKADIGLRWRPFYLRRLVLALLVLVFVLIIGTVEALLFVSNANDGLGTANAGQHYLWTYGPTAVLTLVAALWGRVDFQSKAAAPWIRLSQRPHDATRTLLLDYITTFQLAALFRSLRNRDFTVSITVAVSILIKILIIVSTGLITLSWIPISQSSHPMEIKDVFIDDPSRLPTGSSLPYYTMQGLMARNLSYPDGLSREYAVQTVRSDLPTTAKTLVTVDGLTNWLTCQPASMTMPGAEVDWKFMPPMNLSIAAPGCSIANLQTWAPAVSASLNESTVPFARFLKTKCDGTTDEAGRRLFVAFGNITYTMDYTQNKTDYTGHRVYRPTQGAIETSTHLLCTPSYCIYIVDVLRNGTQKLNVTETPGGPNRTLASVSAWNILAAHFSTYGNSIVNEAQAESHFFSWNVSNVPVDVDPFMSDALQSQLSEGTHLTSLFDPNYLQLVASGYYREYAAIIVSQSLLGEASLPVTGSVVMFGYRLVLTSWATQWMAGLAAACALLAVVALFTVPTRGILPCGPRTLLGVAAIIQHSPDLLERLRDAGAADDETLSRFVQPDTFSSEVTVAPPSGDARFVIRSVQPSQEGQRQPTWQADSKPRHPVALHPVSRGAVCAVMAGLIVALELLLRKSSNEAGLGQVWNDGYIHYTWTSLPAIVFGGLAAAISAMDFSTRSIVPYSALVKRVGTDEFTVLDFLDMTILRAIYRELKYRHLGAFVNTVAFLVASFFTIFSGSLFQPLSISSTTSIVLQANQSSNSPAAADFSAAEASLLSALILENNYPYPQFSYEHLAFPQFIVSNSTSLTGFEKSEISMTTVVPALRARRECRSYKASQIQAEVLLDYHEEYSTYVTPLAVSIDEEVCGSQDQRVLTWHIQFVVSTYPNSTHFGLAETTGTNVCSDVIYTWGRIDQRADPIVQHVAGLGCNVSVEAVDVDTVFTSADFVIDPSSPPRPQNDTARPIILGKSFDRNVSPAEGIYYLLPVVQTRPAYLLDPFFSLLTTSLHALPVEQLGVEDADAAVADAIRYQHGILHAQTLAAARHLPAAESNATLAPGTSDTNDAQPRYAAMATIMGVAGGQREVMDAPSTRALQALLGVALAGVLVGWVALPRPAVLPRTSTGALASVAAVVAGGNLLDLLPAEAARRGDAGVAAALGPTTRFWLGWA